MTNVWLSLDIGHKRTGVALSESGLLARPLAVVTGSRSDQIRQVMNLITTHAVTDVVVGQPARATEDHPTHQFLEEFKRILEENQSPVTITVVDETLTTKEAERIRVRSGQSMADTDELAAQLLLEDYFVAQKENHAIE